MKPREFRMPLNVIRPNQFVKVLEVLTERNTVYVIPSFQRPYAWENKQIEDLTRDMEKAGKITTGYHYLSALHLIPLDLSSDSDPLTPFIEDANKIFHDTKGDNELITEDMNEIQIYAVVDGQQRLTTLFLLAHIFYQKSGKTSQFLEVCLSNGRIIPRLIQNPRQDHDFMMKIVDYIWGRSAVLPIENAQSQKHMLENFRQMKKWSTCPEINFLASPNFKTTAIELDPAYGLTSFMTLNDRGKDLTILEKFKSLLLQFVYDANQLSIPGASGLIMRLHGVFGHLYQTLNLCLHVKLFPKKSGDASLVRLLSCYIRLDSEKAAIWQSAEEAYSSFFRAKLLSAQQANIPGIVSDWCNQIEEINDQLDRLNGYLNRSSGFSKIPSLHFPGHFSVCDDYRATLLSLGFQPHLLALLLKFRVLFKVEWHQRFSSSVARSSRISPLVPITNLLNDITSRASPFQPAQGLTDYLDHLRIQKIYPKSEMSMLEVIERMQIMDWNLGSRKNQTFVDWCRNKSFQTSPSDYIYNWLGWRSCDDFVESVLYSYNDGNLRFLLKEYERSHGVDLHFLPTPANISSSTMELEHIFSRNIDNDPSFIGFSAFAIVDRAEFDNIILWRSGNFTWLSASANSGLGNAMPHIKAGSDFVGCLGHPTGSGQNICSDINITKKVGDELCALGTHYPSMRFYVEARCAELALFAIKRFG
jgi:hypothetical protein